MRELMQCYFYAKEIGFTIEAGHSLRSAVIEANKILQSAFSKNVERCVFSYDHGQDISQYKDCKYNLVSSFFDVVVIGLNGYPILEQVNRLEVSIKEEIDNELQKRLLLLPLKSLLPVVFLMLPAYLVLLFGPLIQHLLESL